MAKNRKYDIIEEPVEIINNFSWLDNDNEVENNEMIGNYKLIKKYNRNILISDLKKQKLNQILTEYPNEGEIIHLITNGSYDLYNIVDDLIDKYGAVDELIGSTWCMNSHTVMDLKVKYKERLIKNIILLTGDYFKLKQRSEYGQLYEFMQDNKLHYKSCKNHAKILAVKINDKNIVVESSANFTTNPRVENFTIYNDKELYDFHKSWIMEAING